MSIPTIDFTNCLSDNPEDIKKLSDEVTKACKSIGFFEIVNHPVSYELQKKVMEYSALFFNLPTEDKMKISFDENKTKRGYELFGSQTFEKDQKPDIKEGYNLGRELPLDHPLVLSGKTHCGPNVWPDKIKNFSEHADTFKEVMNEYMAELRKFSRVLMNLIASTIKVDDDYFDNYFTDSIATLRLLHYPAKENLESNERGIGAHTDWGAITFLMQDDVGGLQVLNEGTGEWFDVYSSQPGALICNLGDMMPWITNDEFHSNKHRVLNKQKERYSVAFFVDGHPDFVMKCLPGLENSDGSSNYPPLTVGEYLAKKYYDTQQEILDQRLGKASVYVK